MSIDGSICVSIGHIDTIRNCSGEERKREGRKRLKNAESSEYRMVSFTLEERLLAKRGRIVGTPACGARPQKSHFRDIFTRNFQINHQNGQ
eukprot:scaffold5856_cov159-Skeletonema_dohrnii-CCMP3373.AAC.7